MTFDLRQRAEEGVLKCRLGKWEEGMVDLTFVGERDHSDVELPGQFYSYLGYGLAHMDKKYREGLLLCQHSIKIQYFEPENHLNLARTLLLMRDRRKAFKSVAAGLALDSDHPGLRRLCRELGLRRRPVLPFLPRANPINSALGRFRHSIAAQPQLEE